MLKENTLKVAKVTTLQLEDKNVVLAVATEGPLHDLVDAAQPIKAYAYAGPSGGQLEGQIPVTTVSGNAPVATPISYGETLDQFINDVDWTTSNTSDEEHSKRIRALADDIAPFVSNHISVFRNVVKPIITDMEAAIKGFIQKVSAPPAQQDFEIIRGRVPELLKDEAFLASGLETCQTTDSFDRITEINYGLKFAPIDDMPAFVNEVTAMGNSRISGLAKDWLSKSKYDLIARVFIANFQDPSTVNMNVDINEFGENKPSDLYSYSFSRYRFSSETPYRNLDIALAYYLLCDYLVANPKPINASHADNKLDYKLVLEENRLMAGTYVNRLMDRIKAMTATNNLVGEYNMPGKFIVVNDTVYQEFLAAGGTNDVLLGFLVSGDQIVDLKLALENCPRGQYAWDTYVSIATANARRELLHSLGAFIQSYVSNDLEKMGDFEKSYVAEDPGHRVKVMEKLTEYISQNEHLLAKDPSAVATYVVAKLRFHYTYAYEYFKSMCEAAEVNPDINPREAAGVATLRYIVSFLLGQVTIIRK